MTIDQISQRIHQISTDLNCDKIIVVTDENVASLAEGFIENFPTIKLLPGEDNKDIRQIEKIWRFLEDRGATRHSLLVNFGGGMVSDMGGFAATTFKRGIRYMNVATTLLAAVDAAIGGKTGVNFNGLKNEVGAFALPQETIAASELFQHLSRSEWLSGYGEMLKTGLLDGKKLFEEVISEKLVVDRDPALLADAVERCAAYKCKIVEADFREGGLRKVLNLGHTAGHAIEMICLKKGRPVAHGIAVAYGIMVTLVLSRIILKTGPELMYQYRDILKNYFPPLALDCHDIDSAIEIMGHDKKNAMTGRPRFVLLEEIGKPVIDVEPTPEDLAAALEIAFDQFC